MQVATANIYEKVSQIIFSRAVHIVGVTCNFTSVINVSSDQSVSFNCIVDSQEPLGNQIAVPVNEIVAAFGMVGYVAGSVIGTKTSETNFFPFGFAYPVSSAQALGIYFFSTVIPAGTITANVTAHYVNQD